jgi:uncharacterized ferritin-like protein (DUF455 family)
MNKSPIFSTTHQLLLEPSASIKVQGIEALYYAWLSDAIYLDESYPVSEAIVCGMPPHLPLVEPRFLKRRRLFSVEGKAALIHAILHIEFNAINIALDAVYRFRGMPMQYYADWLKVAREEAYHFVLLGQHLSAMGYAYGDFPAHQGLWEMVQKTGFDVLARMALVPRLLEARGLDVTPDIARRIKEAGDSRAAEILSIIFQDEITHVEVGNRWYHYLCQERQISPLSTFIRLIKDLAPDYLRGPLAIDARRRAGFLDDELELLKNMIITA